MTETATLTSDWRRRLPSVLTAALLVVTALLAIWSYEGVPTAPSTSDGLHVLAAAYTQTSERGLEMVTTVDNASQRAERIQAWWYVASPASGAPWDTYEQRSAVRTLDLAPGAQAVLTWQEPLMVGPGVYHLSTWLHHEVNGRFEHADGGTYSLAPLRVVTAGPRLVRRDHPSQDVPTIESLSRDASDADVLVADVAGGLDARSVVMTVESTDPRLVRWWTLAKQRGVEATTTFDAATEQSQAVRVRLPRSEYPLGAVPASPTLIVTLKDARSQVVLDRVALRSIDPWQVVS